MSKKQCKKTLESQFLTQSSGVLSTLESMEDRHVNMAYFYAHDLIKFLEKRIAVYKESIKASPTKYKDPDDGIFNAHVNRTNRRSLDQSLLESSVRESAMVNKIVESISVIKE